MNKKYKSLFVWGAIILVVIVVIAWFVSTRNGFVTLSEDVDRQWSEVENQYQRRLDLIPNLVETVKGYAAHEQNTFENVTRARAGLQSAYDEANALQTTDGADVPQIDAAQQQLGRALSIYVNAVREAYPDLKADTQFTDLQTQLEGTENRIATARGRYIDIVRDYNVAIRRFPASMIASMSGFLPKEQFKAQEGAATAPKVSF